MESRENIIKTILEERKNIKNLLVSLRSLEMLKKGNGVNDIKKSGRKIENIERILKQSRLDDFFKDEVRKYVEFVKSEFQTRLEDLKKNFGKKLEGYLEEIGIGLAGQYPLLKALFYTIEVDLESNVVTIWFGPQQEKLATCNINPEQILKKLKNIHEKITKRNFNDITFLEKLYEAYKIALYRANKGLGAQVSISDVLFEYTVINQDKNFKADPKKSNYKEYNRVFFSYDLYRLRERRIKNVELELITATRSYTRKKSDFLWIPLNDKGEGFYISHIRFRELRS